MQLLHTLSITLDGQIDSYGLKAEEGDILRPIQEASKEDAQEYHEGQKWLHRADPLRESLKHKICHFQQRGLKNLIVYPKILVHVDVNIH